MCIRMAKKWSALTPSNLAILGALDDFYRAYKQCLEAMENSIDRQNQCIKQYRKICEPLLQQYTSLFTALPDRKLHANAFGFANFTMSYFERDKSRMLAVVCKAITFTSFLEQIHFAVIKIISRWNNQLQPSYVFNKVEEETNQRILGLVEKQKHRMTLCKSEYIVPTQSPLYLIGNLYGTRCYKEKHKVETRIFGADLYESGEILQIPAHFCTCCKKYFIGKTSFSLLEDFFGWLLVEKRSLSDDACFDSFQWESKLHRLGYNVIDGQMCERERRDHLLQILESGKLSYHDICASIEQDINLFQNSLHHQLAVQKWKDDLCFLADWMREHNGLING